MSLPIVVRAEAEAELREAYAWYEERRPGLGDEFLRAVDVCMVSIQRAPKSHPVIHRGMRRALLRRFPYGVFYFIGGDAIFVIAVFHLSRCAERWMERAP